MAVPRVTCPDCGAEQTSPTGFTPGRTVRCARCDVSFRVPGERRATAIPAADEPDEPPKRNGWLTFVAVTLTVVVLGVAAYAYVEAQRERAQEAELAAEDAREEADFQAARARREAMRIERLAKGHKPPDVGIPFLRPPQVSPEKLSGQLVGVWRTAAEPVREIEYRADGTFHDGTTNGTWKALGTSGTKVLKVERSAGRSPVRITFEGDELLHDGDEPGVSLVLKRKSGNSHK